MDIGGLPVIVADTAGLRHTDDVVESIGVDRAQKAFVSFIYESPTDTISVDFGWIM